jgi:UPF0271 protein
MSGVKGLEDRI